MTRTNDYGQPIGDALPGWTARQRPPTPMPAAFAASNLWIPPAMPLTFSTPTARHRTGGCGSISNEPFADAAAFDAYMAKAAASADLDAPHHRRPGLGQGHRHGRADAHGSRQRRDRGRARQLFTAAAAHRARHGGAVPVHDARLRRTGLSPFRVEVRQPERTLAQGSAPLRLHLRGIFRQAIVYKGRTRDTAWLFR